jgi:glycosyltransferase involved in cell wall biosynthesis
MACGLPIVAFDTPVNREILGFKGIYSRYGDRDSLAFSIIEALRSPEKCAALGVELRKEVEASFSWEQSVERILSCYEGLL